jgi:hypothetical protein
MQLIHDGGYTLVLMVEVYHRLVAGLATQSEGMFGGQFTPAA